MIEKHEVTNHLEFAKFDYISEFDSNIKLGDVVYRKLVDKNYIQEEIGVVIQTYGDSGGDFRTDMFGNTWFPESSFATLEQIEKLRPELLIKLKED